MPVTAGQSAFARKAGLDVSIVSRFRAGKGVEQATLAKIEAALAA